MVANVLEALKHEPVRVRIYTLAGLVLGYLVTRGVLSPADAEFYGSVAVVVLGVESSRRAVTPVVYTAKHRKSGKGFWGGH